MKQSLQRRLRGKPLMSLQPLSVSLLLMSLVVVLHSVSSLDKSFDEESVLGQKRSPGYKHERKQALKSPKEENDKPNDELLLSLIEKYLKKDSAEKQQKLNSHIPVATPQGSVKSKCGIPYFKPKPDSKIVGGVEATPHSWPWQVSIKYSGNDWTHSCGGSVLNSRWVITAAHCVDGSGPTDFRIVLGAHNITKDEGTQKEFEVEEIIMHKDYDNETINNDIALIRLSKDVKFNRYIKPICLPDNKNDDVKDGTLCVATGWGETQSTGDQIVLNQVYLPVISNSQCNEPEWYDGGLTENMICAGYAEGGKDACQGDSGGPLVSFSKGKWKLYGVTSFGRGCAQPQHPGIYTRVKKYLKWIQKNTEQYE